MVFHANSKHILAAVVGFGSLAGISASGRAAFSNPIIPNNLNFPSGSSFLLSDLIPSGSTIPAIQVFDKIFYNFHYVSNGTSMPTAAGIMVSPKTTALPTWGLEFTGSFGDDGSPGASDALISYEVAVTDPNIAMITDAHIDGNPAVQGSGQIVVTETWVPDVNNKLIRVYDLEPGSTTSLTDAVVFAQPTSHLFVQKDIQAHVPDGSTSSVATMSFVDQTYSQNGGGTGRTPEPSSLGLLVIGAAGILIRKRRA